MKKTKKILGLGILGFFVVGFGYLWVTDIQPDIDRVTKLQEERQNQPSYIEQINERYSSVEDCEGVSGSSPPEIRERCTQIYQFARSSNP